MERAFEGTVQITVHSKTRKIVSRDLKNTLSLEFLSPKISSKLFPFHSAFRNWPGI